jgi:hypothetical protein
MLPSIFKVGIPTTSPGPSPPTSDKVPFHSFALRFRSFRRFRSFGSFFVFLNCLGVSLWMDGRTGACLLRRHKAMRRRRSSNKTDESDRAPAFTKPVCSTHKLVCLNVAMRIVVWLPLSISRM